MESNQLIDLPYDPQKKEQVKELAEKKKNMMQQFKNEYDSLQKEITDKTQDKKLDNNEIKEIKELQEAIKQIAKEIVGIEIQILTILFPKKTKDIDDIHKKVLQKIEGINIDSYLRETQEENTIAVVSIFTKQWIQKVGDTIGYDYKIKPSVWNEFENDEYELHEEIKYFNGLGGFLDEASNFSDVEKEWYSSEMKKFSTKEKDKKQVENILRNSESDGYKKTVTYHETGNKSGPILVIFNEVHDKPKLQRQVGKDILATKDFYNFLATEGGDFEVKQDNTLTIGFGSVYAISNLGEKYDPRLFGIDHFGNGDIMKLLSQFRKSLEQVQKIKDQINKQQNKMDETKNELIRYLKILHEHGYSVSGIEKISAESLNIENIKWEVNTLRKTLSDRIKQNSENTQYLKSILDAIDDMPEMFISMQKSYDDITMLETLQENLNYIMTDIEGTIHKSDFTVKYRNKIRLQNLQQLMIQPSYHTKQGNNMVALTCGAAHTPDLIKNAGKYGFSGVIEVSYDEIK